MADTSHEVCVLCRLQYGKEVQLPKVTPGHLVEKHRAYGIRSRAAYLRLMRDIARQNVTTHDANRPEVAEHSEDRELRRRLLAKLPGFAQGVSASLAASVIYDLATTNDADGLTDRLFLVAQSFERERLAHWQAVRRVASGVEDRFRRDVPDSYWTRLRADVTASIINHLKRSAPVTLRPELAVHVLGEYGSADAFDLLRTLFSDTGRRGAAKSRRSLFGVSPNPDALDAAKPLLIILVALHSLGRLGDRRAVEIVRPYLVNDGDSYMRAFAAEAAGLLGDPSLLPQLLSIHENIQQHWNEFKDELGDVAVRIAIARLADDSVQKVLSDSLNHHDPRVKVSSFVALARLYGLSVQAALKTSIDRLPVGDPAKQMLVHFYGEIFGE